MKEKVLKIGLRDIEEPSKFDISDKDNISEVYYAFENMRRGILAKRKQEEGPNKPVNPELNLDVMPKKYDPVKYYLVGKNAFKSSKPAPETITNCDLLDEEIKEINKLLKYYKPKKQEKSATKNSKTKEEKHKKQDKDPLQDVEKAYYDVKEEANAKIFGGEYGGEKYEENPDNIEPRIQFKIKNLWEKVNDKVNEDEKYEKEKEKNKTEFNKIDEKCKKLLNAKESNSVKLKKGLAVIFKDELNIISKLIKKGAKRLGVSNSKTKEKSDKQMMLELKNTYESQKKLAEMQGIKEISDIDSFNIRDEDSVKKIFTAFKNLRTLVVEARKKKLEDEKEKLNAIHAELTGGGDKNNEETSPRIKEIKEDIEKIDKKIEKIKNEELEVKTDNDGEVLDEVKQRIMEYSEKVEADLMRLMSSDNTELKDTQDKKFKSGGKSFLGSIKKSLGDFVDNLRGKPVELSVDKDLVIDFNTNLPNALKNDSTSSSLNKIITTAFSNRKEIYSSWFEYICKKGKQADTCFNGKAKMSAENAIIILMYIFLRSLVHARIEDVNSVRKGLKAFTKKVSPDYKVGNVPEASKITLELCQNLKNNMLNISNRKKSADVSKIIKKEKCMSILDFVNVEEKSLTDKKIKPEKFKKSLKAKLK